jgi:hypothetical protein
MSLLREARRSYGPRTLIGLRNTGPALCLGELNSSKPLRELRQQHCSSRVNQDRTSRPGTKPGELRFLASSDRKLTFIFRPVTVAKQHLNKRPVSGRVQNALNDRMRV